MGNIRVGRALLGVIVMLLAVTGWVLLAHNGSATGEEVPPSEVVASDVDDPSLCAGTEAVSTRYDLGSSFNGLARVSNVLECRAVNIPSGADVVGEVPPPSLFGSAVYGSCTADAEAGCPYPLEVQSWPQCNRNLSAYKAPSDDVPSPVGDSDGTAQPQEDLTAVEGAERSHPWDDFTLSGFESIPAVSFDGGRRIEIYTGHTTIVVFADTADLASRAAQALASPAADEAGSLSASLLLARALGQEGSC